MTDFDVNVASLLALIERLSAEDRARLDEALAAGSDREKLLAALEGLVPAERPCPHCGTLGAAKQGKVSGLTRYRCGSWDCRKTFNALTGTPLAHLQKKERWLGMVEALTQRLTVRKTASRCGVCVSTAHRWRLRFLKAAATRGKAVKLGGATEMDVTEVRENHKGSRKLPEGRKPRKRGGSKGPGADKATPILMAVERGGDLLAGVLRNETAGAIRYVLGEHIQRGATIYTDGARNFGRTFRKMGVNHQKVVVRHRRVRGAVHVQTVNNRHSFFHSFLAPFRGVASKNLPVYLEWFRAVCHHSLSSATDMLSATLQGLVRTHA